MGALVMVVHICLLRLLLKLGFDWSPDVVGWVWEGLPVLRDLAVPIQHFRSAVPEGWSGKVSADLCAGLAAP